MNIVITNSAQEPTNNLTLTYSEATKWIPLLRNDYFSSITLEEVDTLENSKLNFLIHFSRILKSQGNIRLNGNNPSLEQLLLKLHFFKQDADSQIFLKTKPDEKKQQKSSELAIGFKGLAQEEEIDEGDLLKEEGINLAKKQENCSTKPRACANCNCGRSKQEEKPISKEELIKKVNEGQPVGGCGKCTLGDSFRCGTCPFKGFPAFKPGDKLKLEEEGGVTIEQSPATSLNGKVKIAL